ncbi:MAG: class I SAM-dependent methyltransferase [Firmicutes bacterium]|nr:class I SAM-dependent methyltransferase [Bacillota bacterium]
MMTARLEREYNLRNHAANGNLAGLREILDNPGLDFDINSVDPEGRSALFLALYHRMAAEKREIIDLLMAKGAFVRNGAIFPPSKIPKLLTRRANAKNLEVIFQTLGARFGETGPGGPAGEGLILEIGSGEGYLKYLLSLSDDPWLNELQGRIVETEPSPETVRQNLRNGKYTIAAGISGLVPSFGRNCFSGVVSFNVLDTFPTEELDKNLRILSEVIRPGGLVVHIMSSAVHENIFAELQSRLCAGLKPNLLLLPYCREGRIGLRLAHRESPLTLRHQLPQYPARYWFELFAQNPAQYVELADQLSRSVAELGLPDQTLLLADYSREKIKNAFRQAGFELLCHKELTSNVTAPADEYQRGFAGVNFFHNVLGTLITDHYGPGNLAPGEVVERSTFLWIAGIKKKN